MAKFVPIRQALSGALETASVAITSDTYISGLATGIMDLDFRLGGLHPSELVVIAARTSMGKTALAINIATNVARARLRSVTERPQLGASDPGHDGAVVGIFSFETKAKRVADRILSHQADIPFEKIRRGMIDEAQFKRLVEASQTIDSLPLFVDDTPAITIADIDERARELQREKGLGLLIVDYLQLVAGGERQGEGRYQEIAEITAGLKSLAMSLDIPIVAISQLSRSPESRDDKRPILTDLVGSGSIENDADVVVLLFREEYYVERAKPPEHTTAFLDWVQKMQIVSGVAEIIVAKNRHGPIGTLQLQFESSIARFSDMARDHGAGERP